LEESLSVEELIATIKAIYAKEDRFNKFQAALQGVDLDEQSQEETTSDITTLTGYSATKAGFGIGLGLGYVEEK
jgi:hypothetical protein